jgi:hypothetical protein
LKRGEIFSASYSAVKFCADAIGLVFLLNRRYAPFYKWLHRAVRDLPLMGQELHAAVGALLNAGAPDQQADIMEAVSVILADELRRQGLSDSRSDFLLDHAPWVQANIIDERLRKHLSA